ncbi:catalase, partial [Pediococcus acidilactici]|nr:catalase [Pediococcus acidilactici]
KNMTNEAAAEATVKDTDYLQDDLYDAIAQGENPSWTLYVQILPYEAGLHYKWDIFDVTKVVSHKDYPLIKVGKMVLNENPTNNFTAVEEAAMSPANLVPGIEASPDKILQGRLFSYKDTQRYRLGANFEDLPINRPVVPVHNYERDGAMKA